MPSDGRNAIKICPYAKHPGSAASKHPMRPESASMLQGARAIKWHVPPTSRYRDELIAALTAAREEAGVVLTLPVMHDGTVATWDVMRFAPTLLICNKCERLVGAFPDVTDAAGETWEITPIKSAVPPVPYTPAPLTRRRLDKSRPPVRSPVKHGKLGRRQ